MSVTALKGFDNVGQSMLSDTLETNLVSWFQWGFLEKGGFWNVKIPTSGAYGGEAHRLRPVADPSYTNGQVWEAYRQDWIWETGVNYAVQPIRVSGVFVDGNFKPATGVGAYKHYIDYRFGKVVFDTPISTGAKVTCEYSYRLYNVTPGNTEWWRQIQTRSYRIDNNNFGTMGSGMWNVLAENRIQLPAIIVQVIPSNRRHGYEIGSEAHTVQQDVLFHVVSETSYDTNQLSDIITAQQDSRIILFNKNDVLEQERFALDYRGSPAQSGLMYPDLIKGPPNGYGWRQARFMTAEAVDQPVKATAPLFMATVRGMFEVELP